MVRRPPEAEGLRCARRWGRWSRREPAGAGLARGGPQSLLTAAAAPVGANTIHQGNESLTVQSGPRQQLFSNARCLFSILSFSTTYSIPQPLERKTPCEAVSPPVVSPASSSMKQQLLTSSRIQQRGMHLPLSQHCTHGAMELALETDELRYFPLLLVWFAYYFLTSSHNTFSRRSRRLGDFCCSATLYLKRDKYTHIMQKQMLKLLAFFLHYYFTEFSLN